MNDKPSDEFKSLAASGLVSASVLASLVGKLAGAGVLSDADTREIYDTALLLIEEQQASASSDAPDIYTQARQIIEDQLRRI